MKQVLESEFRDAKHTRATYVAALAGFLANAIWAAANVFVGEKFVTVENALVSALFLVALLLVRRNRHGAAASLVSIVFLSHMTFVALTFGYGSGAHQFFLLGTVIPYLVFPRSARLAATAFAAFSGLAYLACVFFRDQLPGTVVVGSEVGMAIVNAAFLLVILAATTAFFVTEMRKSDDALQAEYKRSEELLYNLLPTDVAARLKREPDTTIADELPNVAILFADMVGFTERSTKRPPDEIVRSLNGIFTRFDELAKKHGLEKIKTIGDAYMVAAGVPVPCKNPVQRVAEMALDILETITELPEDVQIRIGLHTGPVVAGVIGNSKLFYDVWGETVNTASRMESHGEAGRIQVTKLVRDLLSDEFVLEPRGAISVKGLGHVETWWLVSRRRAA